MFYLLTAKKCGLNHKKLGLKKNGFQLLTKNKNKQKTWFKPKKLNKPKNPKTPETWFKTKKTNGSYKKKNPKNPV